MTKDLNDLDPIPPELRRKVKLLTEGPFSEYQKKIFQDIRRVTEPYERYHKQFLETLIPSKQLSSFMSEIIAANNSSIALFREALAAQSWQLEMEKVHESWAEQFVPMQRMIDEIQAAATFDLSSIAKNLTVSESITQALNSLKLLDTPGLNATAFKNFQIEQERLSASLKSVLDSITIPNDYLSIPYSAVSGASREIFTSSNAFGTLFPAVQSEVPFSLTEEENDVRAETADCVDLIKLVDPELAQLYYGSIEALESSSVDKARHVLVSLRELWMHVLHRLAPDQDVIVWSAGGDPSLVREGKPTRRARALYLCRNVAQGDLKLFVERDTDSIVSLFDVFNDVHKVNPQLTDAQLRALVLRAESYMKYLIQLWRETR